MTDIKKKDLVSVIIPAYRAAEFISEALSSIAAQTYPDWEVVVVEDGTDDGTAQLVAEFGKAWGSERVRYHRHPRSLGPSAARNQAIQLAKGTYIALLDHDDRWEPEHLSITLKALSDRRADLVYAQAAYFDGRAGNYRQLGILKPTASELEQFTTSLMQRVFIPVASVVMKRTVWSEIGGFDTQAKIQGTEDLDFWLRAIEAEFVFAYVPEITAGYRKNIPTAATANKAKILESHAEVLCKNRKMKRVSRSHFNAILAKSCFGVARRSRQTDWKKACRFFLYPWLVSPQSAVSTIIQVAQDYRQSRRTLSAAAIASSTEMS